ncbi:MAG: MBL fold metallo-hydrolase [Aigarchaeota archaeon]|nr:MBL fold metallo-hydrolase [Aigarchaeota archaeon]MDW7986280.1 MBL fold metallo-hydrolase RNA specificity domain-containing protein [Nitrososphaerota archaeon]
MATICLLGGVEEVGGNKILISGRDGSIFIDFGLNLKKKREYDVGHGLERINRILRNYLLIGILPEIRGIYRKDIAGYEELLKSSREINVDGCIISHGHLDHYGSVVFLKPEISIATSRSMKALIEHSIETSGRTGIDREVFIYKDRRYEELKKIGEAGESLEEVERPIIIFEEYKKIKDIPVDVTPMPIDHSVPATFGLYIEVDKTSIAYTSDIRLHGTVSRYTRLFIEKVENVDYLLIEGTRIQDSTIKSEEEVKNETISESLKKKGKLISVVISSLDIDRLKTMIDAARECNRVPVLSPRLFHLIKTLKDVESRVNLPRLEDVRVYFEKRSIIHDGYFLGSRYYRGWLKELYENLESRDILIKAEEISKNQEEYLFIFSGLQYISELVELNPIPGSLIIESTSEPHDEEQEIEWEKVENWIRLLRLDRRWIHASGHANREDLIEIIKQIKPKTVIPIHTENPREFKKLLEKEGGIKVEILREGEEVNINLR